MRRPDCDPSSSFILLAGRCRHRLRRPGARSSSYYHGHQARQPRTGSRPRSGTACWLRPNRSTRWWRTTGDPLAMSEVARDPLAELARLLPTVLDESALHELAVRLQPLLPAGEPPNTGKTPVHRYGGRRARWRQHRDCAARDPVGPAGGRWPHRPFAADQSRRDRQVACQHDRDDR